MNSYRVILIFSLPIILLVSGCSVAGLAQPIDVPRSLIEDSETAARQVQDCHLRIDVEFSNSLLEDRQVLEIWYARPDRMRIETLESTQPGFQDIIAASAGSIGWIYQHAANQVDTGPIDEVKPAIVYDLVRSGLDLWLTPEHLSVQDVATDYVIRNWTFELSGVTEAATCTVWLNAETLHPVQLRCRSKALGTYTMTVTEAEYNVGLTDEIFDLTLLPTGDYTVRSVTQPTAQTPS